MFTYDENKFFAGAGIETPCAPVRRPLSQFEQLEYNTRELRMTLERFMNLERTMKEKYDDHVNAMTQDNVTFKSLMEEAWKDFTSAVRAEINMYETNVDSLVVLFEKAVNDRIAEIEAAFGAHQVSVNEMLTNFETEMTAYLTENLNNTLETLLHDMKDNGALVGVIDSSVVVSVKQHGAKGDGVTDDTAAFTSAIAALGACGTLYVPNGKYLVDGAVNLVSNMAIVGGANVEIIRKPNALNVYEVLALHNVENVVVSNLIVRGERATHTGTEGEWGNVVSMKGAKNVRIENCLIADGWGDGVYIGTGNEGCENISIINCEIENNRRNGVSVVNVEHLHIKGCTVSNTQGTSPQMAIDFEGNTADEGALYAVIEDCVFRDNKFGVGTGNGSCAYDVIVKNCTFYGQQGMSIAGTENPEIDRTFHIKGCYFFTQYGITIGARCDYEGDLCIEDCHFDCGKVCIGYGDAETNSTYDFGAIQILNCYFHRWDEETYPIRFINKHEGSSYSDIVIDCRMRNLPNAGVYMDMKTPAHATINVKKRPYEVASSATVNKYLVHNSMDVDCTSGEKTVTFAESFPYGVPIVVRKVGTDSNRLGLALESGMFAAHAKTKMYPARAYEPVTICHEAAGVWSIVGNIEA